MKLNLPKFKRSADSAGASAVRMWLKPKAKPDQTAPTPQAASAAGVGVEIEEPSMDGEHQGLTEVTMRTDVHELEAHVAAAEPEVLEGSGLISLYIGSLSNCSVKDAEAYARSLIEQICQAPVMAKWIVFEDKPNSRFIYEIHEGGPGKSIGRKVIAALEAGTEVRIALVNEQHASIEDAHGELFTLRNTRPEERLLTDSGVDLIDRTRITSVHGYLSATPLKPAYSDGKNFTVGGFWVLGISAVVLCITGLMWSVSSSGVFDSDEETLAKRGYVANVLDTPIMELDRAKAAALEQNKIVGRLEKKDGKWTYIIR